MQLGQANGMLVATVQDKAQSYIYGGKLALLSFHLQEKTMP